MGKGCEAVVDVKSYSKSKGYGFVIAEGYEQDVFLASTCLERAGLDCVIEGDKLRCLIGTHTQKGPRVTKVFERTSAPQS